MEISNGSTIPVLTEESPLNYLAAKTAKKCKYVKVDVCRFHYLKNGLSLSRFSFLLFCRLLVLWQKIVASFLGHVACLFYPLEGLTIQHHTLRNELGLSLQVLYPRHYAAATNSYTNLEMTKHVAKFLV